MSENHIVKLKDVISTKIQNGYSPLCQEDFSGVWVLSLGALTGYSFDSSQIKAVDSNVKMPEEYRLKDNDILVSRSNTLDKVGRCGVFHGEIENCFYPDLMMRFRADEKIVLTKYLETVLQSEFARKYFQERAAGTSVSMMKINKKILEDFSFSLPSLMEQEKIIEITQVWDSAIEKTEKLISEKEKKLQWIIIHCFEAAEGNKNWIVSKLSEFLKPGDKHPVENTANYRKITIKLHKNGIEYINSQRKMADTRPFYIRRAGELIIGKQNYFNGSIALLEKDFDGAICSNAIMSFSIAKSVNPNFLLEAISTRKYLREKSVYANGTGQKELSENAFLNFDVKLPSLKVQNEIMEIVNLQKSEISLLKKQLEQYKLQKQGLMQKLLNGEWRVK